jgi:hypothetical protein
MFWRIALIVLIAAGMAIALLWYERVGEEGEGPVTRSIEPYSEQPAPPRHPLPEPAPGTGTMEQESPAVRGLPEDLPRPDPEPEPEPEPLPPLGESDDHLLAIARAMFGDEDTARWLVADRLAERLVVFVDSLDRAPVPVEMRPIVPVPGAPVIETGEDGDRWDERNFRRYRGLVAMLESISPTEAASLYVQHYPLLQEAHSDLAPETRYFNDRLVEIIDHLLEAEHVEHAELGVEPYEAVYRFAEDRREAASAGHKILWRIGPEQSVRVREWLMRFRGEIASD